MSLRLRLALWYGSLTGLVIMAVSLLAYAAHSRALYDQVDRSLVGAVEHVVGAYTVQQTSHELTAMLSTPILPNVAVRVHGPNGDVLAASPNAGLLPAVDPREVLARPSGPAFDAIVGLAPPFATVDSGRGAFGLIPGSDRSRWRLYAVPVDGMAGYLLAATPLGGTDAAVETFRRLVPVLTLIGAVITLVGGGLIAGRALRPVALLTQTAGAIARSRSFAQRVPVGTRGDELGRLAATFNEMLSSLEQAYHAQQRFVADASHELRAPLTAIQANLELLERRPEMAPAEQREAIDEACREARRLAHLVADLLALARADAGVPLRRRRVELDRVLLDALGDARHLARGQQIQLDRIDPTLVEGDPDRLKQLLLILLDNALKYTPAGGQVTLGLQQHSPVAIVVVQDTGIGISPEDLPHVFERFYRADPARAPDPGGTGLGLPIAEWIAQQHGGSISLTSERGKGTTATVRLPMLQ
ncbi:MAG: HAMP domain-containing histidine kinase [Chloroflexi bacterium]|nr:HAMP domain-containing histidine kinase [Chloroflexota bacterium]